MEKKMSSNLAIVADRQYFSLIDISSLLLQLIGSYGQDSPVYQYCFAGNPTWNCSLLTSSSNIMDVSGVSKFSF
jgi:hypothetical protein